MEYITYITDFMAVFPEWIKALTLLVTGASALTALTPTKTDNKIVSSILRVLNIVSLNIGKNKNADA